MKTMDYLQWIDRYNSGELDQEEEQRFQEQLKVDEKLNELYNLNRDLKTVMENETFFRTKSIIDKIHEKALRKKQISIKRKYKLLAAAASVVILISAGVVLFYIFSPNPTPAELYNRYFSSYEILEEQRSADKKPDRTLYIKAAYNYTNGDFVTANQFFSEYLQTNPVDVRAIFAYGVSLLHTNNPEKAIGQFKSVLATGDYIFMEASKWYLALAYLKTSKLREAKNILENIIENGYWKHSEASTILRKLD